MARVKSLAKGLGRIVLKLLKKLLAWHWRTWKSEWSSAWREPDLLVRAVALASGLGITVYIVPRVIEELGVISGVSFVFASYMALAKATYFRVARVGEYRNVPLGLAAPVLILVGTYASQALSPLLSEAKNAALAKDFISALVISGVYVVLWLTFRPFQGGRPN